MNDMHASSIHGTQGGEGGPVDKQPNDAPAARGMFAIVVILLVVCSVIAAIIYATWNPGADNATPRQEQQLTE